MNTQEKRMALEKLVELMPEFNGFTHLLLEAYACATRVSYFPEWFNTISEEEKKQHCQELYQVIKDAFKVVDLEDPMKLEEKALAIVKLAVDDLTQSVVADTPEESQDFVSSAIVRLREVLRKSNE